MIERIAVKIVELRGVSLEYGALKRCGIVDFYKNSPFKLDQALEMLNEEHYVFIINVFVN